MQFVIYPYIISITLTRPHVNIYVSQNMPYHIYDTTYYCSINTTKCLVLFVQINKTGLFDFLSTDTRVCRLP